MPATPVPPSSSAAESTDRVRRSLLSPNGTPPAGGRWTWDAQAGGWLALPLGPETETAPTADAADPTTPAG